MRSLSTPWVMTVALLAAVAVGAGFAPLARSQIQASPSYIPIGVAASGNTSTAWFHEPSSRQALACTAVGASAAGPSAIQCVTVKLPQ